MELLAERLSSGINSGRAFVTAAKPPASDESQHAINNAPTNDAIARQPIIFSKFPHFMTMRFALVTARPEFLPNACEFCPGDGLEDSHLLRWPQRHCYLAGGASVDRAREAERSRRGHPLRNVLVCNRETRNSTRRGVRDRAPRAPSRKVRRGAPAARLPSRARRTPVDRGSVRALADYPADFRSCLPTALQAQMEYAEVLWPLREFGPDHRARPG